MNPEREGKKQAERFRADHRLGVQPLGDLIEIVEHSTRADVAVVGVGPDEHGLTMCDPERGAVFVAVAATERPMRQRFTLAHELAHVVFADWEAPDGELGERGPRERRADSFARHLLVPSDGLRAVVGSRAVLDEATLSAVVQRFLVSPQVAAIAMEQAGLVDEATKGRWFDRTTPALAARFGWSDHYAALATDSARLRAPQRLLTRAIDGYVEGVVPLQVVATLRGLAPGVVEAEFRATGVVPAPPPDVAWAAGTSLPDVDLDALDRDFPEDAG
ncbi:ImmA/IrrE family metallo-endopeptidase [Pseudonocardia alni]|uniref:ImmA/IrrE family metallo-endopeptidase n=1 Tax=Pseudonocardia alni TaxID=33907 RepID=UPI003329F050